LPDDFIKNRLEPPSGKADVVLDTDTYNEVDDQFALAYCMLAQEKMNVEAVYAAPFHNNRSKNAGDGMLKSYDEIFRVLEKLGVKNAVSVFKGSERFLSDASKPAGSPVVDDLIERAMNRKDNPLYVLAMGAPTNISSALLIEPGIREKIVVVWLGSQPLYWKQNREFNCRQDIVSSQVLYDSGVPFVDIPCKNTAEHLVTTVPELEKYLKGKSAIGDYLCEIVRSYGKDSPGWSKVIWDIAVPAYVINPEWVPAPLIRAPVLTGRLEYEMDDSRHYMRIAEHVFRDSVFGDLFDRLTAA